MELPKGELAIELFKSYPQLKQKTCWAIIFWHEFKLSIPIGMNGDMIRRYVLQQEEDRIVFDISKCTN